MARDTVMTSAPTAYDGPTKMLIGGQWLDAADHQEIPVESPATRTVIASVPRGSAHDVDRAVKTAAEAFGSWRSLAPRERGKMLSAIGADLEAEREKIARTIAQETGNAIRPQSRPEANTAADVFRYFGGIASELKGETIPLNNRLLSYNLREPLGVVGAIIPWNSPVSLGAIKIAMALGAGNTLVLKAAEDAPLAVLRMAEVCMVVLATRPSAKCSLEPAEIASWNDIVVEMSYDSAYAKPMPKPIEAPGCTLVRMRVPLTWYRWAAGRLTVPLREPNRATGSTMRFTFRPAEKAVTPLPVAWPLPAMILNGLRPVGSDRLPVTVNVGPAGFWTKGW